MRSISLHVPRRLSRLKLFHACHGKIKISGLQPPICLSTTTNLKQSFKPSIGLLKSTIMRSSQAIVDKFPSSWTHGGLTQAHNTEQLCAQPIAAKATWKHTSSSEISQECFQRMNGLPTLPGILTKTVMVSKSSAKTVTIGNSAVAELLWKKWSHQPTWCLLRKNAANHTVRSCGNLFPRTLLIASQYFIIF